MKTRGDRGRWVLLPVMIILLWGCQSSRTAFQSAPGAVARTGQIPAYVIQPGDELEIKFFYNPDLNETVRVRPDGKITLQLLDEIPAGGKTPAEVDRIITQQYAEVLKKPVITVMVRSYAPQRVYVAGEVNRQGLLDLTAGLTALEAVIQAEGLKETADPAAAIVIRKGPENEPIPIRVDLKKALRGDPAQAGFKLQPSDIVYVPKTFIAEANKFVNQYVERLLLFRGVSLGFYHEIPSSRNSR